MMTADEINEGKGQLEMIKLVKAFTIILTGSILLGCLMLFIVYMIPVERMRENIVRSSDIFLEEGDYPATVGGYTTSRLDNFTDTIMCSIAICPSPTSNVFVNAMNADRVTMQHLGTHTLVNFSRYGFHEGNTFYYASYTHYWHGYLVALKPLLFLFDYGDLRILNLCLQMIGIAYIIYLLSGTGAKRAIPAFTMMLLVVNPVSTGLSLQFASLFNLILITMIVLLRPPLKLKEWEQKDSNFYYAVFFFIIGIITAYIDLLTYPIAVLGLPLALLMMLHGEKFGEWKKQIRFILLITVCWLIGYGGMWCGKFVIGTLITGENIIADAWASFKYRTSSTEASYLAGVISTIYANIRVLVKWPYVILLVTTAIMLIISNFRQAEKYKWISITMLPYLIIAALPLLHMMAVNHASKHYWFTYREFGVSIFAFFCMLVSSRTGNKASDRIEP